MFPVPTRWMDLGYPFFLLGPYVEMTLPIVMGWHITSVTSLLRLATIAGSPGCGLPVYSHQALITSACASRGPVTWIEREMSFINLDQNKKYHFHSGVSGLILKLSVKYLVNIVAPWWRLKVFRLIHYVFTLNLSKYYVMFPWGSLSFRELCLVGCNEGYLMA